MAETFTTIVLEKIGAVARLTLNRPQRANALNAVMLREIGSALDEIERDSDLRAVIVRGAGAAFSSGFDLKEQMERRPKGIASGIFRCRRSRRCAGRASPAPANSRSPAT
jgi:enoyl-CoA hydratase